MQEIENCWNTDDVLTLVPLLILAKLTAMGSLRDQALAAKIN